MTPEAPLRKLENQLSSVVTPGGVPREPVQSEAGLQQELDRTLNTQLAVDLLVQDSSPIIF